MVKSKFIAEVTIEYDIDTEKDMTKDEENAVAAAFRRLINEGVMLHDLQTVVEREFSGKDEIKSKVTVKQMNAEVWIEGEKKNG